MQSISFQLYLGLCDFLGNLYIVAYGKVNSGLRPIWNPIVVIKMTRNGA